MTQSILPPQYPFRFLKAIKGSGGDEQRCIDH